MEQAKSNTVLPRNAQTKTRRTQFMWAHRFLKNKKWLVLERKGEIPNLHPVERSEV